MHAAQRLVYYLVRSRSKFGVLRINHRPLADRSSVQVWLDLTKVVFSRARNVGVAPYIPFLGEQTSSNSNREPGEGLESVRRPAAHACLSEQRK